MNSTSVAVSASKAHRDMSEADKAALKQLQGEEIIRTGRQVKLVDIIAAVTPGMADPEYLTQPMLAAPITVNAQVA